MKKKTLSIIKDDPWLEPFEDAIVGRHNDFLNKEKGRVCDLRDFPGFQSDRL